MSKKNKVAKRLSKLISSLEDTPRVVIIGLHREGETLMRAGDFMVLIDGKMIAMLDYLKLELSHDKPLATLEAKTSCFPVKLSLEKSKPKKGKKKK